VFTSSGKESVIGSLSQVWIGSSPDLAVRYSILSKAWMPKGWKLDLAEIDSEALARPLIGKNLFVPRNELPPLSGSEFYLSDLIGLEAFEWETQRLLGVFQELQESGETTKDIKASWWIFKTPQGLLSVPAVSQFIEKVDLTEKKIWLKNLKELP